MRSLPPISGGAIDVLTAEQAAQENSAGHRELGLWLVAFGFFVGVATDLVVAYGGG